MNSKKRILVSLVVSGIVGLTLLAVWNDIYSSKKDGQSISEIGKEEVGAASMSTTEVPVVEKTPPLDIVPAVSLVGKKFPFCGRDDVAPAYSKIDGDELYIIPACQQIIATISETNLIIFEVLDVSGEWIKIVSRPEDQLKYQDLYGAVKEYNISLGVMEQESWIRKDRVTTAWSIEDGEKSYFVPAFAPSIDKNSDGTWNLLSTTYPCNYLLDKGDNPIELRQNISYVIDRDCGT